MATQPQQSPPKAPSKADPPDPPVIAAGEDPQEFKQKLEKWRAEHAQPDPPVKTVADEQRERSAEIEKVGLKKWLEDHDDRPADERVGKTAPGVNPSAASVEGRAR